MLNINKYFHVMFFLVDGQQNMRFLEHSKIIKPVTWILSYSS